MTPETDAIRWACSNSFSAEKFDAWLAAHDREIQAQALRDAADEVSGYAWQPGDAPARVMPIEEQRAYMGGAKDAHAIVDRLLRDRAACLTATTEEPCDG